MDKLLSAIGWEYLRTKALVLEDGRYDLVEQQKGFKFINPTEAWFPGMYGKQLLLFEKYVASGRYDFEMTILCTSLSNGNYQVKYVCN